MSMLKSRKSVLVLSGVVIGWFSLALISNFKQIRHLNCQKGMEGVDEVICRAMQCGYKYYFFVPFSEALQDLNLGYSPREWCIESVLNEMNP